ncbi:hypothetical protein [Limnobacter sp. CACIAM 66H1]|uniref:hypothetical protein n=1 Tax=Limnobacter sp. CACIAM 66H1 TaxID=1813033 RepID=UPI000A5CCD06|nr:hypothetical protein [Limnobacter sp. CACIAM 66H1]
MSKTLLVIGTLITVHESEPEASGGAQSDFDCQFEAIESSQPFRPERKSRKPQIKGPLPALVVGPEGREIHTDEFGRIKIQFYWDRYGKHNQDSSCWVRVPLGGVNGQPGGLATFGESSGSGQSAGAGAIRVEVGDINRPGLGGFLTVLPFEGSNLLPGQVVYLAGPERKGTQAFFYDGARSLDRIPVVYNGSLLLSPQEAAALTTAQGAVVLARQEQTRSVVRTENVAGKIINGVVAEVGPGRPATEGEGGATKPGTCDAEASGLSCAP